MALWHEIEQFFYHVYGVTRGTRGFNFVTIGHRNHEILAILCFRTSKNGSKMTKTAITRIKQKGHDRFLIFFSKHTVLGTRKILSDFVRANFFYTASNNATFNFVALWLYGMEFVDFCSDARRSPGQHSCQVWLKNSIGVPR